jgi:hypothetical protein
VERRELQPELVRCRRKPEAQRRAAVRVTPTGVVAVVVVRDLQEVQQSLRVETEVMVLRHQLLEAA